MPLITITNISKDDVEDNPDVIFMHPENDDLNGGSTLIKEIRGEDNVIGIRVKKNQFGYKSSYFTDDDFAEASNNIDEDFECIEKALAKEQVVIVKSGDFMDHGVREYSPDIYDYVLEKMVELGKL